MALSQRFSDVTCDVVDISSLKIEQTYPIVKAERVKTGYGETVLLSIRDPPISKCQRLVTFIDESVLMKTLGGLNGR